MKNNGGLLKYLNGGAYFGDLDSLTYNGEMFGGLPVKTPGGRAVMLTPEEKEHYAKHIKDAHVDVLDLAKEEEKQKYAKILDMCANGLAYHHKSDGPKIMEDGRIVVVVVWIEVSVRFSQRFVNGGST